MLGALASPAAADPIEAKLAEFHEFAKQHRLQNKVLSMSYAIVRDDRIVAAEGIAGP